MNLFSPQFLVQMTVMLFSLFVVVLLAYLILRWFSGKVGGVQGGSHQLMSIQSRLPLDAKKALWIVQVSGDYYLLGTQEQGITMLDKLDPDKVRTSLESQSPSTKSFMESLFSKGSKQQKSSIPTTFEVVSDGQEKTKTTQEK